MFCVFLQSHFLVYFRPPGLEKRLTDCLLPCNFVSIQIIILSINLVSKSICNSNRTEWSPVRSVIIRVINKIRRPLSGSSICLTTSTITDRIGGHEVLSPFNHNFNKFVIYKALFLNLNTRNSKPFFCQQRKKAIEARE